MVAQLRSDKNHRPIPCDTCDPREGEPTMLQAWVSDELLAREEVSSIDELSDADIHRLAGFQQGCSIEGHCLECNGPDDGDDGNSDD